MKDPKYEFVIVGSGAGGATLAKELSRKGKQVLLLERGKYEEKVGTTFDSLHYYDVDELTQMPFTSEEGVILWRAFMAGGSTIVACGNGVRCLEKELREYGIELGKELAEVERETGTMPIPEQLLSDGSLRIRAAAQDLGYQMDPMPKLIAADKCQKCGQCVLGCRYGAKWTAADFLNDAIQNGTEVRYGVAVHEVLIEKGRAVGIRGVNGHEFEIRAKTVILAAGGLATPVILEQSGLEEAGQGLFMDLFVDVLGVTDRINQIHEPAMTLVNHEFLASEGFILSPFVNHSWLARLIEAGPKAAALHTHDLIGLMVKTRDDPAGTINPDASVSKPVTDDDWGRLNHGSAIAKEILVKAGADPESLVVSKPQGAHPGGTAAIGQVVDANLQTRVDNLFVCDSSVLPVAPGLPPILTIAALAKRLARTLAG
jgi:choline dehydrogenase-like flavoprotein